MLKKIALLSNVNMNALIRMLKSESGIEVYEAEGYGNELGVLMNPDSSYHRFAPQITFVVMDLLELLEHDFDRQRAEERIGSWFAGLESALRPDVVYYVGDAWIWGAETEAADALTDREALESAWKEELAALCDKCANVRMLPYHRMIAGLGEENAFSLKMWYMGRILLSAEAQKRLSALILHKVELENRTPKKVLLLDLDHTLWGGLAGEDDHTPIVLSEEHAGLAYKNLQRVILLMQRQGVLLGIVSKNNAEDAEKILRDHPHQVLRPEHFAAKRINWAPKHENIVQIAEELNLGLDSIVFWDDNPDERLLVQKMLPEVTVPDFPAKEEELAAAMTRIYHAYFEKPALTGEDLEKTRQYADNAKRSELRSQAGSFEDYLRQLQIVLTRVEPAKHKPRLEAMINKTNQFNLTTRRHDPGQIQQILEDESKRVFLYEVSDRFGDNGVVAAVIVSVAGEMPVIEEFLMSCRTMGKNIEMGVIDDVEKSLREEGFAKLRGIYLPTPKNQPVAELYEKLGYQKTAQREDGGAEYEIDLGQTPPRAFYGQTQKCCEDGDAGLLT